MFDHLFTEFEQVTLHMAELLMPQGFDVSPDAPQTFEELKAHYKATGRVCVWVGASDQTIFSTPQANYAFRAWHDYTHLVRGHDFTLEGEKATCKAQIANMLRVFRRSLLLAPILRAEIVGQAEYEQANGFFPVNQREFTNAYLLDKAKAIATKF